MRLFLITMNAIDKVPFTINNLLIHSAIFKPVYLLSVHASHKYVLPRNLAWVIDYSNVRYLIHLKT